MDYLADKDYFCMDTHVHSSPEKARPTIAAALKRGLDLICLTDMNRMDTYEALEKNRIPKGQIILPDEDYKIAITDETSMLIEYHHDLLTVAKSEEIRTAQGDLTALFIKELIYGGQFYTESLADIYTQDGIAGAPHYLSEIFSGIGDFNLDSLLLVLKEHYLARPFFLETNGQCSPTADDLPWPFKKYSHHDSKIEESAKKHRLALLAGSDAHCTYFLQHLNVGKYYTAVPRELIDTAHLKDSLADIILNHKDEIKIGGRKNNLFSVLAWMFSLRLRLKIEAFKKEWNRKTW